MKRTKSIKHIEDLALFALFAGMMFLSAQIDIIPNVHPLCLFILVLTAVYRFKALIPIYVYVFLEGLMGGFGLWWIPYLYVWTIMWAFAMLIPKKCPTWLYVVLSFSFSVLHGISFGILYSPLQCYAFYGGDWGLTLSWVAMGLPFDIVHAIGNGVCSLLALPLIALLKKLKN